jgi:glycogenin glucosyltransferase
MWTLLTDGDDYARSACKLLGAARLHTTIPFDANVIEMTNKPLKNSTKEMLTKAGWRICQVDRIAPKDEANTVPRFRDQFTKFHLWKMVEYESAVYFDSDVFVIKKIDHLLQVHKKFNDSLHRIGVTRDIREGSWRSTFNMGVFVVKPNVAEFERLIKLKEDGSVRFETAMSEQGFLNEVYKDKWFEIGFEYNANLAAYSDQRKYWDEREKGISVVHFTMSKPWSCSGNYRTICDYWENFKLN